MSYFFIFIKDALPIKGTDRIFILSGKDTTVMTFHQANKQRNN